MNELQRDRINPTDGPDRSTPFLHFWKTLNEILKSRDGPEMLYGEAHDWWEQYRHAPKGWDETLHGKRRTT